MIPGMPGGRQLAVRFSSGGGPAGCSLALAAYAGVSEGPAARPAPPRPPARPAGAAAGAGPLAAVAALPPPPPKPTSQTPVKSGSFASAVQSSAAGALRGTFWATAADPSAIAAARNAKRIRRVLFILQDSNQISARPPTVGQDCILHAGFKPAHGAD